MKKSFIMIALSLFSITALAEEYSPVQYVCKQTQTESKRPLTMVLTQEKLGPVREGVRTPFILNLFSGESSRPFLTKRVYVETEDVIFDFATSDKTISGRIYLDEMDQTSLELGKNSYRFDCGSED